MHRMGSHYRARAVLMAGTALAGALGLASHAAAAAAANEGATLAEVVVTAQKREQNLQDVPISVTAMTADTLEVNRITNVNDLNALAPNLSVRPAAGGSGIPSFNVRGVTSYGVVPGSDKQISIYIDGVYLGSTRGSLFDFAEIERIEVLRGPQGTLFGRNSTAGAISVVTPDPTGKFGVHQELTYGNYAQYRSKTRLSLPAWGPLSATLTYVHDQRHGDIKNLGAGMVWDRTGVDSSRPPIQTSPKYLGSKNLESFFGAVKFAPSDDFSMVYKFDYSQNDYTPEGVAIVAVNPAGLGGLIGAITSNQPRPIVYDPSGRRPKAVNNSWSVPFYAKNYGHSLTAQLRINDSMSLKNILAYRYGYVYGSYQFDGLGGLVNVVPTLGPVGQPFGVIVLNNQSQSNQVSNETQINYDSKLVTVTAGAIYFHINDRSGPPRGLASSKALGVYPGGRVAPTFPAIQQSYNYGTSTALYTQAEVHVMPQIDLVGGYRITKDKKNGTLFNPAAISFTYEKTKPSYMAGVNYKPLDDVLIYGKFSTGFVSGGSVSTIAFLPEKARSWEAGIKADLLGRRLRTNLSVYDVKYRDLQSAQGGTTVNRPDLSTLIIDLGNVHAKGFELEVTAQVMQGLTVGGGLGYTDNAYTYFTPLSLSLLGANYAPTLQPKWTGQLWGQYETEPVFGDARIRMRLDASYRSRQRLDPNPAQPVAAFRVLQYGPSAWTVNGRIGLNKLKVAGVDSEIALWVRNLNNDKSPSFANVISALGVASSSFVPARTFGVDLILNY